MVSNESLRDLQFRARIMDVAHYPIAVFKLTSPIQLGALPVVGVIVSVPASGTLAMHGATRTLHFYISAEHTASQVVVSGSIPITFADWNIQNPSGGPAQVGSFGKMQFLLRLVRTQS